MKLKYNHNGETESIPLSKKKPEGKRLAVHHDDSNFYAPLVDAGDATASNLRTTFKGEMLAVRQMPAPEIENILIAPPRVSVMQGQSATATVSAEGNEAVAGLSFSIANNPTWITIADECILIQPSDNDQGEAIVEVIAKDTGSDASMSAAFVAEALLRPIIGQLGIVPPAVTVAQGGTSTAIIHAEANSAVGGLSYSLDGAPSWITNDNDTIWVEPTTNDIGTSTVNVVAYDPNSSARADTSFTAEAVMGPQIYGVTASPSTVTAMQTYPEVVTLSADCNSAVTSIEYSLEGAPPWITLSGNLITVAPTMNDSGSVTVTVIARDTGSGIQAATQLTAAVEAYGAKITGITVQGNATIKAPHVAAWQGCVLTYPLTCTANSAVTSVKYSLEGAPAWATVSLKSGKASLRVAPTTANSALGDTATVTLVAYDTGSTARATMPVPVTITPKASIGALTFSETDVTGYPEKAATITINPPSVNSGVTGLEYSLSAHPDWVTLQGDKLIVAPATGETGYQVISIQAADTGSTIVSRSSSKCSVRASVCPEELTSIRADAIKCLYRDEPQTLKALLKTSNNATYGMNYSIKADHDWFSINSNNAQITMQVPDTIPTSDSSLTGSYTVTATNPAKTSSVSATATYSADMIEVNRPSLARTLMSSSGQTTIDNSSSKLLVDLDNGCIDYTLFADATYSYSIPSGQISVQSSHFYRSYLPVTLTSSSNRKTFSMIYVADGRATNKAPIQNGYTISITGPRTTQVVTPPLNVFIVRTSISANYSVCETI